MTPRQSQWQREALSPAFIKNVLVAAGQCQQVQVLRHVRRNSRRAATTPNPVPIRMQQTSTLRPTNLAGGPYQSLTRAKTTVATATVSQNPTMNAVIPATPARR
jgi:hypothetical protein